MKKQKQKQQIERIKELVIKGLKFEEIAKIDYVLKKIRLNEKGLWETWQGEPPPPLPGDERLEIENIVFPEKGVLLYFKGIDLPAKGCFEAEAQRRVDEAKKLMMGFLKEISKISKIKLALFYLFFRKEIERILKGFISSYWETIKNYRFKPERYCQAVRELLRVFEEINSGLEGEEKEFWEKVKDNLCLTLEIDDAYRYRFQLAVGQLNKENLRKNPVKELQRLFQDLMDRETAPEMKAKWRMFQKYVALLRFSPRIFEKIIRVLELLNLGEIKMDEADMYFAKKKLGFNWEC